MPDPSTSRPRPPAAPIGVLALLCGLGAAAADPPLFEFDFGSVFVAQDFHGSVAVDDLGFIYVADVGDRRIQRFAP